MISLDTVLNAYIDANIILLVSAAIWVLSRPLFTQDMLRVSYLARLRLLYAVLLVVGAAPFLAMLAGPPAQAALSGSGLAVNLSDVVVAQYLDGRFAMAPTTFEALLTTRNMLVHEITTFSTGRGIALALVLAAGIGWSLVRMAWSLTRVRRVVAYSYQWRRFGRVELRLTDDAHIPFSTRGLGRIYVVIPSAMLAQPGDLRIALAHEFQHIRQGDLNWELMMELLRPFFALNPAMGYWKQQVETYREMACDEQVMQTGRLRAQDYADCLLRVCKSAIRGNPRQITMPVVALLQLGGKRRSHAERFLRQRVTAMLQVPQQRPADWVALAFLVPLSATIAFASLAIQQPGDWSQDRLMLSTIVNLERLDQRNGRN